MESISFAGFVPVDHQLDLPEESDICLQSTSKELITTRENEGGRNEGCSNVVKMNEEIPPINVGLDAQLSATNATQPLWPLYSSLAHMNDFATRLLSPNVEMKELIGSVRVERGENLMTGGVHGESLAVSSRKRKDRHIGPLYMLNPEDFKDDRQTQNKIRKAIHSKRFHDGRRETVVKQRDEIEQLRNHNAALTAKIRELLDACDCHKKSGVDLKVGKTVIPSQSCYSGQVGTSISDSSNPHGVQVNLSNVPKNVSSAASKLSTSPLTTCSSISDGKPFIGQVANPGPSTSGTSRKSSTSSSAPVANKVLRFLNMNRKPTLKTKFNLQDK